MKRLMLLLLLSLAVPAVAGVNAITGGLTHSQSLFATQGGPRPLTIELSYNSLDKLSGPLGVGWSHNYDIYLHENSDHTMVLTGGVSKRFYFVSGSGYSTNGIDASTLVKEADNTWTLDFRDGLRYRFGSDKKLASITDRNGNRVNLTHASGQTTVTDTSARSAVIHYDANGRIDWIKDPALQQYDFAYDGSGRLAQVTYPAPAIGAERPAWNYLYDAAGMLAYIIEPNRQAGDLQRQISKYVYSGGKVVRSVDPPGVLDTLGAETADAADYSRSWSYGFAGAVPDAGATTLIEKDLGQWIQRFDPVSLQLLGKTDPTGATTSYSYYPTGSWAGRLHEEVTPYDAATVQVMRIEAYDSYGHPLRVKTLTRPSAGGGETVHQHLEYVYEIDGYDRVTSITDQIAGTVTTIAYAPVEDAEGFVASETVTVTAPKINAGDSSGPITEMHYTRGQIDRIIDPLGRQFLFEYDGNGRLMKIKDENSGIVATFSAFDPFGRAETVTVGKLVQPDPPVADRVVTLDYDFLGRLTGITQPNVVLAAGGPAETLATVFDYDLLGNRTSVLDPVQSALPSAEQKPTKFEYNYRGQVSKITDALNQVTELLYSGAGCPSCGGGVDKLVGVKDAKGQQTDFTYDALGRLASELPPGGPGARRLLYDYYPNGQLKEKRRDADGDGLIGAGDQLLLSFVYRPDGQLASKTDHVTVPAQTTTYAYNAQGRLQSASILNSSYTFEYYDNGWLKSVTNGTHSIVYVYDAAGRRELVTVKDGATVLQSLDYVYDATTRELKEIKNLAAPVSTFSFTADAWGRRGSLTYPNGVVASYSYNAQTDWLTGISYKNGAAGPTLLEIAYPEHDKVGNRKVRSEDGVATGYDYDPTYQLTQAKSGASEENFVYDEVGNRKSGPTVKETIAASYSHVNNHRMTQGRQYSYEYDTRGNQAKRIMGDGKEWLYIWDGENRLVKAKLMKGGTNLRTVTFVYDPFGRRVEKKVVEGGATTTTGYLYDGADIVLESVAAGTTTVTTQYVHGPGIDEPLALVRGGQSYFYHADGLGSIVALTDSSKQIVQRYRYESFGQVTPSQPDFANPYTYTGREWDPETGLFYYRARYYDAMEGRFISKDPIGFAGGDVNLYRYVFNEPSNMTDPSGLDVLIQISRTSYGADDTRGVITAYSTVTGKRIAGDTLEHALGSSEAGHTAEGNYLGEIQSRSFEDKNKIYDPQRVRILGSNIDGGQLHNGTNIASSTGCSLAGYRLHEDGHFTGSKNFMRDLMDLIKEDGGLIKIKIVNGVIYRKEVFYPW